MSNPIVDPTPITAPKKGLAASLKAELISRKWRAMILSAGGAIGLLIPNADKLWAWIVAGAMWTLNISAYILGIAIEDNGTKRGTMGDTNINVGAARGETTPAVRINRTSITPFGEVTTTQAEVEKGQ